MSFDNAQGGKTTKKDKKKIWQMSNDICQIFFLSFDNAQGGPNTKK
jgi:hypothetical protein